MQQTRVPQPDLPSGQFVRLVGIFDHSTSVPRFHRRPLNHLYLWVHNPVSGALHEVALVVKSSEVSQLQVAYFKEELTDWPEFGETRDRLSYRRDLQLSEDQFERVIDRSLADELRDLAVTSARVKVYGLADETGYGVHDVHLNSGEPADHVHENLPGDGALVFYYGERPGVPAYALWACFKFSSQTLRAASSSST